VMGQKDNFLNLPQLPATVTEYYTPDTPWDGLFMEMVDPNTYPPVSSSWQLVPRTYKLGRTETVNWNKGVFGPAFPRQSGWDLAARLGDQMLIDIPMSTGQGTGQAGFNSGEGSTTLLADGNVVGEQPFSSGLFDVPADAANYTVRVTSLRSTSVVSSRVDGEWTFSSSHVDGDEPADLPLLAVRFAPKLDDHNAAPAGKRFTIPVSVERNGGPVGHVGTPAVEVSYDDGTTWTVTKVKRDHGQWQVTVNHPRDAKFVSLRASVGDRDGNTHKVTITRAYALR
jgi:hypothetical protein